jgi:hypothetical protein
MFVASVLLFVQCSSVRKFSASFAAQRARYYIACAYLVPALWFGPKDKAMAKRKYYSAHGIGIVFIMT